jgi:hypothetical protein
MLNFRNTTILTASILFLSAAIAAAESTPVQTVGFRRGGDCVTCTPAPAPVCTTYKPCVTYRHRGCSTCGPKVSQVMLVKDPCCCTSQAEVPVCLPACCDEVCISSKCGLFGRGYVTYDYKCGVSVTFTFLRGGDVIVTYRGC